MAGEEDEESDNRLEGVKHTPGRGHQRKSEGPKRRRFQKQAQLKRERELEEWRAKKKTWDSLSELVKQLRPELRPGASPKGG